MPAGRATHFTCSQQQDVPTLRTAIARSATHFTYNAACSKTQRRLLKRGTRRETHASLRRDSVNSSSFHCVRVSKSRVMRILPRNQAAVPPREERIDGSISYPQVGSRANHGFAIRGVKQAVVAVWSVVSTLSIAVRYDLHLPRLARVNRDPVHQQPVQVSFSRN